MIIDTSVIVCLLQDEPERERFESEMIAAPHRLMAAGNWVELAAVAVRKKLATQERLGRLIENQRIEIAPVTAEQAAIGHAAYFEFGIGSGHPAKLNFGDCFAYALAKATGEPLLFKGDDFIHTDIEPAIRSS